MKAKQLLIYVNEMFPDIVIIAKDENGNVYFYDTTDVIYGDGYWEGEDACNTLKHSPLHNKDIEWESDNWYECIEKLEINN